MDNRSSGSSVRFACPRCKGDVDQSEFFYVCDRCGRRYRLSNGVADYRTVEHYWNVVGEDAMLRAVNVARQTSWQAAAQAMWPEGGDQLDWVLDEDRAGFDRLLPINRSTTVLDLGAGWGAISCRLARQCRTVVALDSNPHTLAFIGVRGSQEGLHNVILACADPLGYGQLPFADGTFDLVLMNGVLEWVGSAGESASPRAAQRTCLAEIRRVLKPAGTLYVGIENRYGMGYFLGERDHSGLRYTSLVPRTLASLICRMSRRGTYRWFTYPYKGYLALLREAGYGEGRGYVAYPSYRQPRIILEADDVAELTASLGAHIADIRDPHRRAIAHRLAAFGRHIPMVMGSLVRGLSHSYMFVTKRLD